MTGRQSAAAALSLMAVLLQLASAQFSLTLLNATNALCLDSSPAGYYIRKGSDPSKWIVSWEGGGWCMSAADCASRAKTSLGSSKTWPKTAKFGGVLDVVPIENPDFNTYSMVLVKYCDGASFSGNTQSGGLQYRGIVILEAVIDELLSKQGMGSVKELMVTGGSAGGLATVLHIDHVAARVAAAVPGVVVKGNADCSFFLNAVDYSSGTRLWQGQVQTIVALQNISTAAQVNAACLVANAAEPWRCFFANETYPYVKTPIFLSNSFHDTYQMNHIECYACNGGATKCLFTNPSTCPPDIYSQFTGWGQLLVSTLNASIELNPQGRTLNGGFITSCLQHGQQENGMWNVEMVGGVSMRDALGSWYKGSAPSLGKWAIDVPWPNNPTCVGP